MKKLYIQDGEILREFTESEYAQNDIDLAEQEKAKAERDAKAEIDELAKAALLAKLGITADEAKLLLS